MKLAFLLVHYATLVVLLVGYVQSMNPGWATKLMVWGARAQLVSGLLLAGVVSMAKDADDTASPLFLALKLVVMLAVLAVTEISHARGRRGRVQPALVHAAIGLVLLNGVIAYTVR